MEVFAHLFGRFHGFFSTRTWQDPAGRVSPGVDSSRSLRHLRELVRKRVNDQLESIRDAQLGIDRTEVMSDGGVADEEPIGYLLVLESLSDQRDDFALAICQ